VELDGVALPPAAYDLVLDAHFLDRALFGTMAGSLRPGGLLVVVTALRTDPPKASGPHDPRHLLEPGELAHAFETLELLEYVEDAERGEVRMLARRV
jgi:tellurite methyltransferase